MDNYDQRLAILENWRIVVDVALGKNDVDRSYVKQELNDIKEEIKDFKKSMRNLSYTIWAAVIVLIIRWVAAGGLALPSHINLP